jgi:hypothetical protein
MRKTVAMIVCALALLLPPSAAQAESTESARRFASPVAYEVQQVGPYDGPQLNEEQKMQLRGITIIVYVVLAAGALIVIKKQKDKKGS